MNLMFNCIYFTGGLTRGPMYHNQTLHNLLNGSSLAGASTHAAGTDKNNIKLIYDCTTYVDDPDMS